jgi:hypothetical protein
MNGPLVSQRVQLELRWWVEKQPPRSTHRKLRGCARVTLAKGQNRTHMLVRLSGHVSLRTLRRGNGLTIQLGGVYTQQTCMLRRRMLRAVREPPNIPRGVSQCDRAPERTYRGGGTNARSSQTSVRRLPVFPAESRHVRSASSVRGGHRSANRRRNMAR